MVHEKNWSYSQDFKDNFKLTKIFTIPKPKGLKEITNFPEIFKYCGIRKSIYYKNDESYSDLRVLIFGDSTFKLLSPFLSLYFKELFFYWDHGLFNINLINWFNPDLILEIRIERFLDSIPVPDWIINKEEVNLSSDALVDNLFNTNYKLSIELNEVKEKYNEVNNNLNKVNNKLNKVNTKLNKVNNEKEKYVKLNHEKDIFIDDILNSNSWKITKPLKKIKNLK